MRVAAVQLSLHRGKSEKAVSSAEAQVRKAARKGARLVCLPEHWLGLSIMDQRDPILGWFADVSRDLGIYLNLGANFQRRGGKVFVSSHLITPQGEIASTQDKVHLYRREKRVASPGTRLHIAKVDGLKVGTLVCHDLVFPEPARTLALMGAELLVVPALIEAGGGSPWLTYLRARALENRVPIVSANIYAPPRILGRSCVIDPTYDAKSHIMHISEKSAPTGEGLVIADVDAKSQMGPRRERLRELDNSRFVDLLYKTWKSTR